MASRVERTEPPLVVITGPTASGKTAVAIKLAKQFNGEIICADSRTIYKGMDIGTAKPTPDERAEVPHWGLDIVEPGDRFTAADFKQYAIAKIQEIRTRGHVPFLVGGTGLYVDAVVFDYDFGVEGSEEERRRLERLELDELREYCIKHSIVMPENIHNKRYLIRAIEQQGINRKRNQSPLENSIIVGIATPRNKLRTRIGLRLEQMLADGVVEEAILLGKKYGWESEAMTGNIYPLMKTYLTGTMSLDELNDKFTTLDWRLAKRQLTWLRRNPYIYWGSIEQVYEQVSLYLRVAYDKIEQER